MESIDKLIAKSKNNLAQTSGDHYNVVLYNLKYHLLDSTMKQLSIFGVPSNFQQSIYAL